MAEKKQSSRTCETKYASIHSKDADRKRASTNNFLSIGKGIMDQNKKKPKK
jgi:hypothetical protein